ncbi:MAG TPA: hypothetical protein VN761_08690 [Candidatus Polarisedimenticolia bacterium]|nr:hypothetical protein [Candidatus Polarisedimenticolia bacterium]
MKLPTLFLAGGLFLLGAGDIFAQSASAMNSVAGTNAIPKRTHWRTIKVKPDEDTPKIHFYNKLNPVWWFKNADDPKPPEWYKPDDRHRKLKWSFRNPMHNFNFYVIGVANKKFSRSGKFPERNANPRGGWDFEAARWKFIWLPYVSYHRSKFDFYFGWRNRGNFGIKVNVNPRQNPKEPNSTPPKDDNS